MTWATEDALEHALEVLAERYPGEEIEIIDTFDIANVGWECDSQGALIMRDGRPELVIIDQVGGDDWTVGKILLEKVAEYRKLIVDTERVFARYFQLRANRGDHVLQRAPGESDAEYEERKTLFDDLKKSGGRLSVRVEDLPESVIDRLQQIADEYPDAEIDIVDGSEGDD